MIEGHYDTDVHAKWNHLVKVLPSEEVRFLSALNIRENRNGFVVELGGRVGKKITYSILLLCSIIMLIRAGDYGVPETSRNERIVARFMKPTDTTAEKFHTSRYDVVGSKQGVFIDIVITKSELEDMQLEGYDIKSRRTEAEYVKEFIQRSEES